MKNTSRLLNLTFNFLGSDLAFSCKGVFEMITEKMKLYLYECIIDNEYNFEITIKAKEAEIFKRSYIVEGMALRPRHSRLDMVSFKANGGFGCHRPKTQCYYMFSLGSNKRDLFKALVAKRISNTIELEKAKIAKLESLKEEIENGNMDKKSR